jgi:hypothetical protein
VGGIAPRCFTASGFESGEERVPATFEILFLAGWAPQPGQPRKTGRRGRS